MADFSKQTPSTFGIRVVSAAALALLGACKENPAPTPAAATATQAAAVTQTAGAGAKACCMGLNECKGKGGCAVPESNSCAGKNECKGKGGCNMHCPK